MRFNPNKKFNEPNTPFEKEYSASNKKKQELQKSRRKIERERRRQIDKTAPMRDWKDAWTTVPSPTQAHAFIGVDAKLGHTFRFNPDEVSWDWSENIFSQDTLGGRVVQLLSVSLNGMTIEGRAGSRGELQRLAKNVKAIMGYHVHSLNPVTFKVPSRGWNFKVYIQAMPQISWEVASTSYPYQLSLLVNEDLSGVKTHEINAEILQRLASGIGYDYSAAIHGGDAELFHKETELVLSAGE